MFCCPAVVRVPQAGWQFVLLAVRVQVTPAPDGSFWTLAKKATVLLPAGIALILLVIDTAIAGVMTRESVGIGFRCVVHGRCR